MRPSPLPPLLRLTAASVAEPTALKLTFLTNLLDNGLQSISGYAKPPPRPYLSGICQVDFIAKVRMLYAMHGGVSLIAGQRHPHRFVPLCPWALQANEEPAVRFAGGFSRSSS
jgi:hypothetical protein